MSTIKRLLVKLRPNEKNHPIGHHPLFRSTSEVKLDDATSVDFLRWATENKLSEHTIQMLALEHFDSMSTIKMLQPKMIDILLLSEDEERTLLNVLGQLHTNSRKPETDTVSDSGYVDDSSTSDSLSEAGERMPRLNQKFSQSTPALPSVFTISGQKNYKHGDSQVETSGGSPVSFYLTSTDDSQSIATTELSVETIHSLREEELQDVLEYMVLEEMITREIQEEVLSKKSYPRKVQLLQYILAKAGDNTRRNLEEILRTNYHASLPIISEDRECTSYEEEKRVEANNLVSTKRRRVSWAARTPTEQTTHVSKYEKSRHSISLDIEPFVVNVKDNRKKGLVNPYYEDDDGRMELPEIPLLKFGHKGRDAGELQDATSVTSILNGKIIVTDLVNNRLQSFDNFGAPVQTIVIADRFEPWNVVLSPHGWIACTFRNSKCLSILARDFTEISSIGEEIFESPAGLAVDHCGRYIVTDDRANRVTVHSYDHKFQRFTTHNLNKNIKFNQPRYITVSPQGKIIVSDSGNHCIKVFNSEGQLDFQFGSYGHLRGDFRCPYGVCSDSSGNILVADHYNNRVSMFNDRGQFVRHLVTSSHGLIRPKAIHISPDRKLHITHGGMKASELLVFDLAEKDIECGIYV